MSVRKSTIYSCCLQIEARRFYLNMQTPFCYDCVLIFKKQERKTFSEHGMLGLLDAWSSDLHFVSPVSNDNPALITGLT